MKQLFITFSTLSLLLIAFVACNSDDLFMEQSEQEVLTELRSTTGAETTHYWFRGERIGLTVNTDYVHVIMCDSFLESACRSSLFEAFNIELYNSTQTGGGIERRI